MTSFRLAWLTLRHQRGRSAVSVMGAAFAVVLIFMQLGFLGSVRNTATLFYDRLNCDIFLTSSEYIDLSRTNAISRDRLAQAHAVPGVSEVFPLTLTQGVWRNPTDDPDRGGRLWQIDMVGIPPGLIDQIFLPEGKGVFKSPEEMQAQKTALARLETVVLDELSRPDFGDPREMPPGTTTELNGQRVELNGYFQLGTGFSYTGMLLMSEASLAKYSGESLDNVSYGLIQVAPGENVDDVAARLVQQMPPDVRVFTRQELTAYEQDYWITRTAVGQFFNFGVLLAITVGGIFIYQMMVADIKKHLPEYATLKAMGYRFGFLFKIVLNQSLILAVSGYVIGLAGSMVLYQITKAAAHLPIEMSFERIVLVFGLTVLMCVGSGLLAVQKVRLADPADLF